MGNKLTVQALLYKIAEARNFSFGVILSTAIPIILILLLDINIFFLGFLVYIFMLYTVCYFITNNTLENYKDVELDTYMDKDSFSKFFKRANVLKIILLSLLPITLGIWSLITYEWILINTSFNVLIAIFLLSFLIYCLYAVKKLLNLFVTVVACIKIIKYICD